MPEADAVITRVIHRYHPEWAPPADTGRTWIPTRCPFHGDDRASAAVSYELDAFRCQACPAKGNAVTLIAQQEGVSNRQAQLLAEAVSAGSDNPLPRKPDRGHRRSRLPARPGFVPGQPEGGEVPARPGGRRAGFA